MYIKPNQTLVDLFLLVNVQEKWRVDSKTSYLTSKFRTDGSSLRSVPGSRLVPKSYFRRSGRRLD